MIRAIEAGVFALGGFALTQANTHESGSGTAPLLFEHIADGNLGQAGAALGARQDEESRALLQTTAKNEFGMDLSRAKVGINRSQRKVYFKRDWEGFNNLRYELESAVAFAVVHDRVLVLPEPSGMAHFEGGFFEDMIWDMSALAKVVSYEFLSGETPKDGLFELDLKGPNPGEIPDDALLPQDQDWFLSNTRLVEFHCLPFNATQMKLAAKAVFEGMRFKPKLENAALEKLELLGLRSGDFVGLHLRRGDFVELRGTWLQPADVIAETIANITQFNAIPIQTGVDAEPWMTLSSLSETLNADFGELPVVMATDAAHDDPFLGTLAGLLGGRLYNTATLYENEDAISRLAIDTLMLSHSKRFLSSPGSSFSFGIDAMRQKLHRGSKGYDFDLKTYRSPNRLSRSFVSGPRSLCNYCCHPSHFEPVLDPDWEGFS